MPITSIADFDYVNTLPEPTPFAPSEETINADIERSTYLSGTMKDICGLRQVVLGSTDLTVNHKLLLQFKMIMIKKKSLLD